MAFQTSNKIILITACFLFLNMIIKPATANGISCFKCFASQPGIDENLLCSQFDGSSRFQVYCPSSTLCRKKTIYYKFKTSVIKTVERDCALQKSMIPIYNDVNNEWKDDKEIVKSVYEEGCFIGEDRGAPAGPPEYCFCSFHLCNSSQAIKTMNVYHIFLLTMILLFTETL